jgi:hypothetical protein
MKKALFGLIICLCMVLMFTSACGLQKKAGPAPEESNVTVNAQKDQKDTGKKENNPAVDNQKKDEKTGAVEAKEIKKVKVESKSEHVSGTKDNSEKTSSSAAESKKQTVLPPAGNGEKGKKATLLVTRDFGSKKIFHEKCEIPKGGTVMDLLEANLEINTEYGGGFVSEINGFKMEKGGLSGKRHDWFYYINGICTDMGADGYQLRAGEAVWWDYHVWESMGSANSAVIGCYPEPFAHGYRGTVKATTIMSSPENKGLAQRLQKALKAKAVKTVYLSGLDSGKLEKRQGPVLVMGEWRELEKINYLNGLNQAYRKTGMGVHFTDSGMELLGYNGKVNKTIQGSAAVIAATGEGLGDDSPLWWIAATDRAGLEQAVNIIAKTPEKITGMYSGAVVSGKIMRLPLQ